MQLIDDRYFEEDAPVLEATSRDLEAIAVTGGRGDAAEASVAATVAVSFFNHPKLIWEPLLEPWRAKLR